MSAIPPNWLASGIQAQGAQRRAVEDRDRDAAAQSRAAAGDAFSRDLIDGVQNSDRDSQADTDAEGAGSQGKAFSERETEPAGAENTAEPQSPGLDIEA